MTIYWHNIRVNIQTTISDFDTIFLYFPFLLIGLLHTLHKFMKFYCFKLEDVSLEVKIG